MPVYVNNAAVGANDGTSWANAFTSITSTYAAATGSEIRVANSHAETIVATMAWTTHRHVIISCTTSDVYTAGANFNTTAAAHLTLSANGDITFFGCTFWADGDLAMGGQGNLRYEDCGFRLTGGLTGDKYDFDNPNSWRDHINCTFRFSHAGQSIFGQGGQFNFRGCSIEGSGTPINNLITGTSQYCELNFENCDWSGLANNATLVGLTFNYYGQGASLYRFSGCLMPVGGSVSGATWATGLTSRIEAYSCAPASGATIADLHVEDGYGKALESTTVYKAATYDGSTGYSIQITPKAAARKYTNPFRIQIFEDYLPANPTLKFHLVHDGVIVLNNNEVWLEIEHPNATNPVRRNIDQTSRPATVLTTPSPLTIGSATGWTTTGLSTPTYDEISETLVSGAGVVIVTLCVALANTTPVIYVDPEPDIT